MGWSYCMSAGPGRARFLVHGTDETNTSSDPASASGSLCAFEQARRKTALPPRAHEPFPVDAKRLARVHEVLMLDVALAGNQGTRS